MAKFLDSPLAGVALGAGPVVGAQILGSHFYAEYDPGMPKDGQPIPAYLKWSQCLSIALGLGVAGVLYAMKEKQTAQVAAISAVGGGALGAYYEIKSNMHPATKTAETATPSSTGTPPVSTSTQGAVIQSRGFGRTPMVSLFGRGRTQILGPSSQVAARAASQNVAAFGGGHF